MCSRGTHQAMEVFYCSICKRLPSMSHIPSHAIPLLNSVPITACSAGCQFAGQQHAHGQFWLHQSFFNVTCANGHIQVANCVTERGTRLSLGTAEHVEDGVSYSCKLNFGEGQEENVAGGDDNNNSTIDSDDQPVAECDFLPANGRAEYVRGGYAISCLNNRILGCVDASGDLAASGQFFVHGRGQLRRCVVYAQGKWAKSEYHGCFNGTREDDPADLARFRVPKGRVWRSGDFELRCGEEGIQLYKCLVDGRRIHAGTAWVDRDNVLNVCQ